MAFRISKMTILRATEIGYSKFVWVLKESFTKHNGILLRVAQDLDVSPVTVRRWLREDPSLKTFVEHVRSQQR